MGRKYTVNTNLHSARVTLRHVLSGAILIALYGVAPQALAQTAPAAPDGSASAAAAANTAAPAAPADPSKQQLETVVVTANKRIEKLEHVPMAISVLTDQILQRNNVREFADVINLTPALSITYGTTPANNGINMRGIGTTSIGIGVEADVAVIVDDIPIGMQVRAFQDLADVSRIEVLKGPQSTLFGKSAIAGAVNIVTKPVGGPMEAKTSMYYTSDGEWRVGASVGGALSDRFAFRVAVSDTNFPGNVDNLTTGKKTNGSGGKTLLAKLSWHVLDDLDIDFSPRYAKSTTTCCALVLTSMNPAKGGLLSNIAQLPVESLLSGINIGPDNTSIRNDFPTGQKSTDEGAGLRLTYTLPSGATLQSITSADIYHANDFRDQDFVDVPTLLYYPLSNGKPAGVNAGYTQYGTFDVQSHTEELRLTSPDDDSKVRYVAGLWYGKNSIARHFIRGYKGITLSTPTQYFATTSNDNRAIFGQATWDFLPTWSLLAGLRFNREESGYTFSVGQPPPGDFVQTAYYSSLDNAENATTGKLSLQHQFSEDLMAYVMTSTGYKGLAYDITSGLTAATAANQPVKSETARTYEIGLKDNLLDGRATLNVALFHTRFENYQQNSGSYLPGTTTFITRLNSIPWVGTKGVEIDASALVIENLVLNAGFAYTKARIGSFPNGPCYNTGLPANSGFNLACNPKDPIFGGAVQDLSGAPMPNAPKIKANLGAQYDIPLPERSFDAFVTGASRYQSKVVTNLNQDPTLIVSGYSITNLGAGIRDKADRYKLSFFVNNIFDKHYANTGFTGAGSWSTKAPNPVLTVTNTTWAPARDAFRYYGVRFDMAFR
jgi:iron complex outermembrane receptor protein